MNYFFLFILLLLEIVLVFKLKDDLHILQLNSYRNERYLRWLKNNLSKRFSIFEILFYLISTVLFIFRYEIIAGLLISIFLIVRIIFFILQKHKKPLVFTQRAKRIFIVQNIITIKFILLILIFIELNSTKAALLLSVSLFSLIIILISNTILMPLELFFQKFYIKDAKKIIDTMDQLKVIGITGSYGKTSTKHFLYQILNEKYNTLITPGSYNTTLGVVRTIREMLKPTHEVFIVEMGARQAGDIEEICKIVHPRIGILTAVAEQHLETFKTLENVRKTKFELIDSLPENGLAILNYDYQPISNTSIKTANSASYSVHNGNCNFCAENIVFNQNGMQFSIRKDGKNLFDVETKLLGEHNISNLLAAIVCALHLGVDDRSIQYAIKRIQPVEHRLQAKKGTGGVTILDDAYNSNPVGAKMALEVLEKISGNKKIIITPGFVELGSKQDEYNYEFGKQIAKKVDFAIIVGKKLSVPIVKGIREAAFSEEQLYVAQDLKDALNFMNSIVKTGDVVLFENDLPDNYNE